MEKENKKKMLYELITDKAYRPMKFKEIAGLLQVPKEEKNDMRIMLEELIAEGKIELNAREQYREAGSNLKTGIYLGTIKGFGFVSIEGENEDIFISENDSNGARDKDKVLISIKEEEKSYRDGHRREGMVLKIIEHGNEYVVGVFKKYEDFGFVIPDNQKFGDDIYIAREHTKGAVNGYKVVAHVTDFGREGKNPEGRITEILGHVDDPGVDILSIVRANGIPSDFPKEVLDVLEKIPDEIEEKDIEGRDDFRGELTVTIDGEDAKDLDDAVTISKTVSGYRLGVHIADVSNYVEEGSELDKEAVKRGTSVYLVDRVIPMIPHKLSNGICSLNAGTDRLALSCVMDIDVNGNIFGHKISESVIHVDRRMSYTKVYELIENTKNDISNEDEIQEYGTKYIEMFNLMDELSSILRSKRQKRGSLDFELPESKITLDADGKAVFVGQYDRNAATKIIEDFMLAANETVAEEYFWMDIPFVYRTHEAPDDEKIQKLNIFINNFGYHVRLSNDEIHPKELQKLLSSIEGTDEEAFISRLTLRSMKQAKYSTSCDGHFGLAAKYYCHFTSPIRRYPDLQIHRIIKENLHGGIKEQRIKHYETILPEVASQSSRAERRADEAERETDKLKKAEYMEQFIGDTFEGVISGVTAWGMYVELANTVEGMIRVADLAGDYYVFDETHYCMVGEHTKKTYKLGQKLQVKVAGVDKAIRTVDFIPV